MTEHAVFIFSILVRKGEEEEKIPNKGNPVQIRQCLLRNMLWLGGFWN